VSPAAVLVVYGGLPFTVTEPPVVTVAVGVMTAPGMLVSGLLHAQPDGLASFPFSVTFPLTLTLPAAVTAPRKLTLGVFSRRSEP